MRHATIRVEREQAARRCRSHPRRVRHERSDEGRQHVFKEWILPALGGQSKHRSLLLDFAAAAEHGDRRPSLDTPKQLTRLVCHRMQERLVRRRVVHVGEHEVLPDENAELIAEIVEGVGLVDHRPADAQHVHAGVSQAFERDAIVVGASIEPSQIERSPAGAATEHREAVHDEAETLAIGVTIDFKRPEADASEIEADRRCPPCRATTVTG